MPGRVVYFSNYLMRPAYDQQVKEFEEKVIQVNRVSKKTKGGNRVSFAVLMAIGDRKGRVGVGLGKAAEVPSAVQKATSRAKKNIITVVSGGSIPHSVLVKEGAAQILFKPAPKGTGLIAGGPVRAILHLAGIRDVTAKILGTNNKASNIAATFKALQSLRWKTGAPGGKKI